jgi:hypothetical protein
MNRRRPGMPNAGKRSHRASVAVLAAGLLTLGLFGSARAIITPSADALTIAQSIASPSVTVTGASFVAIPPNNTPNGVSNSAIGGFPVDGTSYGILTSGNASGVDQVGTFQSTSNGGAAVRGDTDRDVSVLKIDLTVPAGANCLSFNFKFMSEEFPNFVGSAFNDAFIAELDTTSWTTNGSTIFAPNNFAFDSSNDVVSINSTGIGGMTPADGAGTAFDGNTSGNPGADSAGAATKLLSASTQVTGGAHSLYLSLFDQGDQILDSAVFLDNLRALTVANPAVDCKAGALQTARLTLVKTVENAGGGTAAVTDWTLSASGPSPISGTSGSAGVTNAVVVPGQYVLSETTGPANYTPGAWACTAGTLNINVLTLAADQNATCTIKNTFVPPVTVTAAPIVTPAPTLETPIPTSVVAATVAPAPVITLPPTTTSVHGQATAADLGLTVLLLSGVVAVVLIVAPMPARKRRR